jgi:hypothetical protein
VEFALLLPVLTLLLVGTVDLARVFYTKVTVANSSRVAAEYGMNYDLDVFYTPASVTTADVPPCLLSDTPAACGKKKATEAMRRLAGQEARGLGCLKRTADEYCVDAPTTQWSVDATVAFEDACPGTACWEPGRKYTVTVRAKFFPITPLVADWLGVGAEGLIVTHTTQMRHNCTATAASYCTYTYP